MAVDYQSKLKNIFIDHGPDVHIEVTEFNSVIKLKIFLYFAANSS